MTHVDSHQVHHIVQAIALLDFLLQKVDFSLVYYNNSQTGGTCQSTLRKPLSDMQMAKVTQ